MLMPAVLSKPSLGLSGVVYKKGQTMEQKQITVTVNKMYKDGQLNVAESSKDSTIDVGLFLSEPATVSVQATHTKNLGNYQSLKIGVIVSVPTYVEELDDAHDFAVKKVSEYLEAELKALDGDTVDPVELVESEGPAPVEPEQPAPVEVPKKRTRKTKEPKVEAPVEEPVEEDHIPTFDTAPTEGSVENPTPVETPKADSAENAPTETVVEEQEVSATMLRGMDFDSLVGIVEANGLGLNLEGYTNNEEGRKALAEDIIKVAFPEENKESVDGTEALTEGAPVEEPEPATPVEETPAEQVDLPDNKAEEDSSEEGDDTPYTFEELSDYTDDELRQVYEYWNLGEFPEKRSMAIKRILEVQEKGV